MSSKSEQNSSKLHYRACNICEAICGLVIEEQNNVIINIKGDSQDTFSKGHICPKAFALSDLQSDPDRLRRPVKRTGTTWQEISWDEALDYVAQGLMESRKNHGKDSIGVYLGNPNSHNYGLLIHSRPFLKLLQSRNIFSATSVDQLPHHVVSYWMYGHQMLIPVPDIDNTQHFLIIGANPVVSNGSLMTAPGMRRRLKAIQNRGGKVVVIDPRKTETARLADKHSFICPGTDVIFLLAFIHVLFEESLVAPGRLSEHLEGLNRIRSIVAPYSPDNASEITKISSSDIRSMAREFARAESAICYGRIGVSTQEFGALCQWLIQLINILTGNLDVPGGTLFPLPAIDLVGQNLMSKGRPASEYSRISARPSFGGELPVSVLSEEILSTGDDQIRALITIAGNPVLSTPNGRQLDKALTSLDIMVSLDYYINETSRHADIILPPTTPLERDHYAIPFYALSVRNVTRFNPPVLPKPDDSLHDWEILANLGRRLGGKLNLPWQQTYSPDRLVNLALANGPYGQRSRHPLGLNLKKLRQHEHGLDLGPLQPSLPSRLCTADKKINCVPDIFTKDLARVEQRMKNTSVDKKLLLIGKRELRSNNSWLHNHQRLVKGEKHCLLYIHPQDFEDRGLKEGQLAVVKSKIDEITVPVMVTSEIMQGVVCLPHGWGHGRENVKMSVATQNQGVNINDLTDDKFIDELSGVSALNGVPVTIHPVNSDRKTSGNFE